MVNIRAGVLIAIGGGRGVGKSAVAANLALARAQDGARVVLVDADGGAVGQHALFGMIRPGLRVDALPVVPPADLSAAVVETGHRGLRLLPWSSVVAGGGAPPPAGRHRLLRRLRALDAEVIVVDVGTDAGFEVLELFDAADHRLVVTTAQLSGAQGAYAFMMGAVLRELRRAAAATGHQARIDEAAERAEPTFRTSQLLAGLAQEDQGLADVLQAALAGLGVRLVGNQVYQASDTNLVYALSRMARDFLALDAPVLGSLRDSQRLHDSVRDGRPYLAHGSVDGDECAATLRTMANALGAAPRRAAGGGEDPPPPPGRPWALPAALPVEVAEYERAYQRHLVDLPATLVYPGGLLQAQLKDVSEGGALLELDRAPPVGVRVTLVVPILGEHSGIASVVRHSEPRKRRAGVQFLGDREEGRRLADRLLAGELDQLLGDRSGTGRSV